MIVNQWGSHFTSQYGHIFPKDYLTLDTEFTGNSKDDLVLEIGHVIVEGGYIVDKLGIVLNWYDYPGIQKEWLDYKLNHMRAVVGTGWNLTPELLKKKGISPLKALNFYYDLFSSWSSRNLSFVAQNGLSADEKILATNFRRFLNKPFTLPENRYFDTGALFKASQIWEACTGEAVHFKSSMVPHKSESLRSYCKRITGLRVKGVKWSLGLILDYYGLLQKHKVAPEQLHSADFDALCLHWIMEEFRSRIFTDNLDDHTLSADSLQRALDSELAKEKLDKENHEKRKKERKEAKYPELPSPERPKRTSPGLPQNRRRKQRRV